MIALMATPQPMDTAAPQQISPKSKHYCVDAPWFLAIVLVLITILAYEPVWHAGFIWDDDVLITGNQMVKASDGLYRFWLTTEAPDYYPLTSSLWWLEWRLWGTNPAGYHITNFLLHAVNVLLLWMILRQLKLPAAWLAALVFAIHPVNVATVAWISEQKNTLSFLFSATTILMYLKLDKEGGWHWYGLSLAAFLLALFSKTAVVMLPFVLLGFVWWSRRVLKYRDVFRSGPFFLLSLGMGLVTVWFQYHHFLKQYPVRTDGFLSRLLIAGWAPWFYLYKVFLPFNLSVIYPKWDINASFWGSYLPGVLLATCLVLFWWKRETWGRPLLFATGYFVLMLFPVLGFFDQNFFRYSFVADHWQYYSIIGMIALAVSGAWQLSRHVSRLGYYLGVSLCSVVLIALGAATWLRASLYANAQALWQDTVAKNPSAWAAYNNLGNTLMRAGRVQDAMDNYTQALEIEPNLAETHNNLATILIQKGRLEDAILHSEQAVKLKPDYAEAHNNLGVALAGQRKFGEAIAEIAVAVQLNPEYAEAHYNIAILLARQGKLDEAIAHLQSALKLEPGRENFRRKLDELRR